MKRSLLFTALMLMLSIMGTAQQLDQTNEASISDLSIMFLCDSFVTDLSAETGAGALWDYSNIAGYDGQTRNVEVLDPAATTNASEFPTATTAIEVANKITNYYSSTASERTSHGFVFVEQTLGDVIAKFNVDAQTVATYPFQLGNSVSDNFSGDLIYNGGASTTSATGNGTAQIDGTGTLNVGLSSVSNVLRYKLIDTSYAAVSIFPPPLPPTNLMFVRHQYEYYDHATTNLPVFIHSTISVSQVGAPNPISIETLVLSAYEPTENVGITEIDGFDFGLYPNPAMNELTVDGISGEATIQVMDQAGRVIIKGLSGSQKIDISNLVDGMYLVRITDQNVVSTRSFIKK